MKSFPTDIKVHALRPFSSAAKNSGAALTCKNVRERKWGLEGYTPDFTILPRIVYGAGYLDMTFDWPFPQIWQTDTGLWIGKRNGLYKAVGTTGTWTATRIANVTTDWPWTLANSPMFPVFASGDWFVYYDYDTTSWITYNGSTSSGTLWKSTWKPPVSVLAHYGQILAIGANVSTTAPSDSRVVRWSEIGAFRFLGQTADSNRNEAGQTYAPTDDNEILLRAMTLGKNVIVYGGFSCFIMRPVTHPAPTFAIKPLANIGITNPLAVAGKDEKHLIVTTSDELYLVTLNQFGEPEIKRLGYKEYIAEMQTDIDIAAGTGLVAIVYNEPEDEFYISNGYKGFIFSDAGGLTETNKLFTSIIDFNKVALTHSDDFAYISDRSYGLFAYNGYDAVLFQSDIVDLQMNAIKVIEAVEVLGTLPTGNTIVEVMIETRVDRNQPFISTKWIRCNPSGVASPIVAGVDFRINIMSTKIEGLTLEGIRVWWKLIDKRNIRGNYVGTATS